jgi:hypothetical protein
MEDGMERGPVLTVLSQPAENQCWERCGRCGRKIAQQSGSENTREVGRKAATASENLPMSTQMSARCFAHVSCSSRLFMIRPR